MSHDTLHDQDSSPDRREAYVHGYGSAGHQMMERPAVQSVEGLPIDPQIERGAAAVVARGHLRIRQHQRLHDLM